MNHIKSFTGFIAELAKLDQALDGGHYVADTEEVANDPYGLADEVDPLV